MIKILQNNLTTQSQRVEGINYEDLGIRTSHIRLKVQKPESDVGLFLNNNPYLITPVFNQEGYWDLNTQNNSWISSIKFNFKTNVSILIEAFYEE